MIQITKYTIRASSPQPIGAGCPTTNVSEYIIQTFGAQKTLVDVYDAKTELLKSADMQGLKEGSEEDSNYRATTYTRASYSGRALRTTSGELVYSGQEEHVSEFCDESEVEGWD